MNKVLLIISLLTFLPVFVTYAGGGIPECEPVTKKEIKYVQQEPVYVPVEIEIRKEVTRKNRLSLLIGNAPSNNLYTRSISPLTTQITRPDENVVGVLYSRDLDRLVLSVMGLNNDTVAFGIGINW